jgi:hypothetical protein
MRPFPPRSVNCTVIEFDHKVHDSLHQMRLGGKHRTRHSRLKFLGGISAFEPQAACWTGRRYARLPHLSSAKSARRLSSFCGDDARCTKGCYELLSTRRSLMLQHCRYMAKGRIKRGRINEARREWIRIRTVSLPSRAHRLRLQRVRCALGFSLSRRERRRVVAIAE